MKNSLFELGIFFGLVSAHIFWLLTIKSQMTAELILPSWILSSAKIFVSESQSLYPPMLTYLISFLNGITGSIFISITFIQLLLVIILDGLLLYYLNRKFKFKLAVIGLLFYIPWQVFFRGNYLWYDSVTIPFIVVSYIFFEIFVLNYKLQKLFLASTLLALGYLFKSTVFWIYGLYFFWIGFLSIKRKIKLNELLKHIAILFGPLVLVILTNFLVISSKGTLAFTFYWNIVMQIFIYPRLPTLARPISVNYYSVITLLLAIYIVCFFIVKKYSKVPKFQVGLLLSFSLISLANIFPRWSDFRMQPFLFFLTIVVTNALYLSGSFKKPQKLNFTLFSITALVITLLILSNRIVTEIRNRDIPAPDYVAEFAPNELTNLIKNKNVFLSDQALYNHSPLNNDQRLSFYKQLVLGLKNPDDYYRITSWQEALNYVEARNPDLLIIPYQIQNRVIAGSNLTGFEKLIRGKYHPESAIGKIYFIYSRNPS